MNTIQAIIGLGNPGRQYVYTRHNCGFLVVDALAETHAGSWRAKEHMEVAEIVINGHKVLLIKPQTFMNTSGKVVPFLTKQGIKPENILVVHDELELPFGQIKSKVGGSAKGHNGLKSIIGVIGDGFVRLRCGIGRPENREQVSDYVLHNFSEAASDVEAMITRAVQAVEEMLNNKI